MSMLINLGLTSLDQLKFWLGLPGWYNHSSVFTGTYYIIARFLKTKVFQKSVDANLLTISQS